MLLVGCGRLAQDPDPGVPSPAVDAQSCTLGNGYGVCCPATGDDIASLAIETSTMSTIHVCDFYDPQQKGMPGVIGGVPIKLIHVGAFSMWDKASGEEADFISGSNSTGANTSGASWAKELAPLGVVFIEVLADGAVVGTGATLADLKSWTQAHAPSQNVFGQNVFVGIDANQDLGAFFSPDATPYNADIDARTLQVLDTSVGFDPNGDKTIQSLVATLKN